MPRAVSCSQSASQIHDAKSSACVVILPRQVNRLKCRIALRFAFGTTSFTSNTATRICKIDNRYQRIERYLLFADAWQRRAEGRAQVILYLC